MEIQKNSNSQSNLERRMELKESTYLTSGYATKLQSLRQYGTSTNDFTVCMEIQKTSNSQSNLQKEEWNWRNQPARLPCASPTPGVH